MIIARVSRADFLGRNLRSGAGLNTTESRVIKDFDSGPAREDAAGFDAPAFDASRFDVHRVATLAHVTPAWCAWT